MLLGTGELASEAWLHVWESGAIGATSTATFKLLVLVSFVGWLLRTERLPPETSTILSKVRLSSD